MYHTLKSLYETSQKSNPELFENFRHLAKYCTDAYSEDNGLPPLNRGFRSLKWFCYVLRENLSQAQLESAFISVCEQFRDDESVLYNDITKSDAFNQYQEYFNRRLVNLSKFPVKNFNGFKILINESEENITNRVFKHNIADIIVFRNTIQQSAGIIFDQRGKSEVIKYFDVTAIHADLSKRKNEKWSLVGRNLIVCGGAKGVNKTCVSTDELMNLIYNHKID